MASTPLALKNVPQFSLGPSVVEVLAINHDDRDINRLRSIFSHTRWELHEARNCRAARDVLETRSIGVILCECDLPDGSWRDLLKFVSGLPNSPLLIVTSWDADNSLWAEVLNLGAYDVLSKPFDKVEVTRIVSLAWLHWREHLERRPRKPASRAIGVGDAQVRSASA